MAIIATATASNSASARARARDRGQAGWRVRASRTDEIEKLRPNVHQIENLAAFQTARSSSSVRVAPARPASGPAWPASNRLMASVPRFSGSPGRIPLDVFSTPRSIRWREAFAAFAALSSILPEGGAPPHAGCGTLGKANAGQETDSAGRQLDTLISDCRLLNSLFPRKSSIM
jgi:hypothetical protein